MTNNMNYAIKHICVNGKLIMYKLINKNNKNTYIRVNRQHEIEVIASPYISESKLQTFIQQHIERMNAYIQKKQTKQLIGDQLNYIHIFGDKYLISIVEANRKSYEIIGHKIYLKLKKLDDKLALIKTIYQDKTAIWITKRFKERTKQMQVSASLKFQWMVSKWGVCDYHKKQVTLALQLGSYSQDVVDYVIVHELAHLYQPNHSPKFWDVVRKYIPTYKKLIQKIKLDD